MVVVEKQGKLIRMWLFQQFCNFILSTAICNNNQFYCRCVPCPQDSESTNLDTDELEDHCVCLPCMNDCGFNRTVVVKKKGTGFPGNCCDLYECKPIVDEKENDCVVGDIIYENGEEWSTDDKQQCRCKNGISLCARNAEEVGHKECVQKGVQ